MCCLALLLLGLGPRVALVFWWIFGTKVDVAFDSWAWPLLGLIFLPWTTLCYVIAWSVRWPTAQAGCSSRSAWAWTSQRTALARRRRDTGAY